MGVEIEQTTFNSELITVVIPTIEGREAMLSEALESCIRQVGGAPSILSKVDVNKVGPATIRNELVELVATPWVVFLDDDDIFHENYLERMIPHLKGGNGVVYSWCVEQGFEANLDRPFDANALRGANFIPVTTCVRTDLFRQVGGFPIGKAYEDWALWLKLLDAGTRFKCVEEKLWTYRRHAGSRTYVNQHAIAMGWVDQV